MSESTTPAATNPQADSGIGIFNQIRERCARLLGEDDFLREASFVMQAVAQTPSLQACTRQSIIGAMLQVANTGLTMNPVRKEAYLIPRNVKVRDAQGRDAWEKRCFVEPSYVGLMKLATDTGAVRNFEAQVVWEGDEFEYDLVEKRPRIHKPYWTRGTERGEIKGVYGFATLGDGTVLPEHMGADELALIRSKSDNANGGVYKDWQGEMARKALVKRLQKYVPRSEKSERFLQAVEADNASFNLAPDSGRDAAKWQDRVRVALDFYQGEDREAIRAMCREKAIAGEFNEAFARNVLAQIGSSEQD